MSEQHLCQIERSRSAHNSSTTFGNFAAEVWKAPEAYAKHGKAGDAVHRMPQGSGDGAELKQLRAHVFELANNSLAPKDLHDFLQSMHKFESRAGANKISAKQISESYANIARLLEGRAHCPVSAQLRRQLAVETMLHCADPTIISQGTHYTCNVTTVEVRTYSKYPEQATRLVADIATTGSYTTDSGVKVKLEANNFKPDGQALARWETKGFRSYATQLFNITATNVWYSFEGRNIRFEQYTDAFGNAKDKLVDFSKGKPEPVKEHGQEINEPHLLMDHIAFVNEAISGHHDPLAVLTAQDDSHLPAAMVSPVKATVVSNEHQLNAKLERAQREGVLPSIVMVDTNMDPFKTDSGANLYGDDGGAHVVNVTAYNKTPATVSIDNQWDKASDHPNKDVRLDNLFLAMAFKDGAETEIRRRLDCAANASINDPVYTFEDLEFQRSKKNCSTSWRDDVVATYHKMSCEMRDLAGSHRQDWLRYAREIVNGALPIQKASILRAAYEARCMTEDEFGSLMAGASKSLAIKKQAHPEGKDLADSIMATQEFVRFTVSLPASVQRQYHQHLKMLNQI